MLNVPLIIVMSPVLVSSIHCGYIDCNNRLPLQQQRTQQSTTANGYHGMDEQALKSDYHT